MGIKIIEGKNKTIEQPRNDSPRPITFTFNFFHGFGGLRTNPTYINYVEEETPTKQRRKNKSAS